MTNKSVLLACCLTTLACLVGCRQSTPVQSISGTKMITSEKVATKDGMTIEQKNIRDRIKMDNTLGAVKHLYVVSAYSGQVLIYSTVQGKVTSSGKRLTPNKITGVDPNGKGIYSMPTVSVGNHSYTTDELLGEDGTVGSSIEFLYWWDAKGIYHQHYVTGGQIVHISDQPVAVKSVVINMEVTNK